MICELINMSDAYTLETDDFVLAGVAIYHLAPGYGVLSYDDRSLQTPVMFGWDKWFAEQGIDDPKAYVLRNADRAAQILESVQLGGLSYRRFFNDLREVLPAAEYESVLKRWTDKRRTSSNNIGKAAKDLALRIRQRAAETVEA